MSETNVFILIGHLQYISQLMYSFDNYASNEQFATTNLAKEPLESICYEWYKKTTKLL